jgi:hypothetical protein
VTSGAQEPSRRRLSKESPHAQQELHPTKDPRMIPGSRMKTTFLTMKKKILEMFCTRKDVTQNVFLSPDLCCTLK